MRSKVASALILASSVILGRAAHSADVGTAAIQIRRKALQPYLKGPPSNFVGPVRVDPLPAAHDPASRISIGSVTFDPGARPAWHTHPAGQTLIVTAGLGWVQQAGGSVEEIRPGDVLWIPRGVKHWHDASATNDMTHLAIQESVDGRDVDRMEPVSGEQYRK